MKQDNTTTDNTIFTYAFLGVILCIAAISFTFVNVIQVATLQLSSALIAGILGATSFSLLYKAIKQDKNRLNQA